MANTWFRVYAEFANDPKVQMMSEAMQRRYVMLMCFRCSNVTETLHETELAFALRITDDELAETKKVFMAKGFINDQWELLNWDKRQFASDSSASRVARHRAKIKEESNSDVTLQKRYGNALDTDTDTDNIKPIVRNDVADQCPHQEIINLYHEHLPMLTRVKSWTDKRANQLKLRWREDASRQNLEYWEKLFRYIAQSDFLTGKTSDFQADLEWITKSANFVKIIEGKYENKAAA